MLYYLFQYLEQFNFPGARMFGYVSFRSLMAVILSLLISAIFGEYFINLLKKKQITETQRDASIDPFNVNKVGVPTMGGIIIIVAILIPCLLLGKLHNIYMILMLVTTLWLGTLGFLDDYIKVFRKDKEGLHGKFKIIGQVGLGLIVGLALYLSPDVVIRENIEIQQDGRVVDVVHKPVDEKSTKTTIPFFKNNNLDYADFVGFLGEHAQDAGWIVFVFITIFVVTAVSNGANLNDGMDGMAAGNSAIIGVTLGILAYVSSHIEYAEYLNIMYIPGSEELVIFICAFIGALVGFLWYNAFPAQVFMGDTGSLTIGGLIAVFAIIIHKELLIPILCGVFLVENLSVILQVKYFQRGKKKGIKQRIFKRSPIHDHFRTTGLIVGLALYLSPDVVIRENIEIQQDGRVVDVVHKPVDEKSTKTTIPFFKNNNLDYADFVGFLGEHAQDAGWIVFVFITIFVVTAVSNGANLNDGMDGMAAGNSAIIGVTLGILAYVSSHIEYAEYLNIMYIPGSEELVIFICAFIGALVGFLWYNAFPAQVFMGDTGSLTIGGLIAVFAIIIHKELLIPILCGVFLVENLSVILQVKYFQRGKKKGIKQRIFKRSPIHDHFRTTLAQLDPNCTYLITRPHSVYHESKITVRFWIVTIVLAAITIITLKIR